MTLDQLQAVAAKLKQLVNGAALVSGQLVIHFDSSGVAQKAEILQVHRLAPK